MPMYHRDNAWVLIIPVEYFRFEKRPFSAARVAIDLLPGFEIVERDVVGGDTDDLAYTVI